MSIMFATYEFFLLPCVFAKAYFIDFFRPCHETIFNNLSPTGRESVNFRILM